MQQRSVLQGFISVCSYCHKVHVEETTWAQMEEYISERTLAEFTHGICPSCYRKCIENLEAGGRVPSAVPPPAGGPPAAPAP